MRRTSTMLATIGAGALLAPIAALSVPAGTTTARGVYTAEQAEAGAQLYTAHCAMCHGKRLEGSYEIPALNGRMIGSWGHYPLSGLVTYVSRAMPQMAPGSLSADDNAKIVAYLLQQNGMPAGKAPLASDPEALKSVLIEPVKR